MRIQPQLPCFLGASSFIMIGRATQFGRYSTCSCGILLQLMLLFTSPSVYYQLVGVFALEDCRILELINCLIDLVKIFNCSMILLSSSYSQNGLFGQLYDADSADLG